MKKIRIPLGNTLDLVIFILTMKTEANAIGDFSSDSYFLIFEVSYVSNRSRRNTLKVMKHFNSYR